MIKFRAGERKQTGRKWKEDRKEKNRRYIKAKDEN